jgi:hypothetical protein
MVKAKIIRGKQNLKKTPEPFISKRTLIIISVILVLGGIIGIILYFTVFKNSGSSGSSGSSSGGGNTPIGPPGPNPTGPPGPPGPTSPPLPTNDIVTWVQNLYKTLIWNNQLTSSNSDATPVSSDWINNWALTHPNSILQYYVNYRRTSQGNNCATSGTNFWPTQDPIDVNPVYSWDGLVTAIYIWNQAVALNNQSNDKPLGDIAGFCDESDINLRSMSLAAFLANATVESAYFMVCKESTILNTNPPVYCPGTVGSTGPDRYNPRYCNNCDQGNPRTYSCQGGGSGSSDGPCNPTESDENTVCNTPGCYSTDAGHYKCTVSKTGGTWQSWDDSTVKTETDCMNEEDYKYKYWCPSATSPPAPVGPTTTQPPFNPTQNNCTGGWPVCQISSPFKLPDISTDPCMSDPQADGSFQNPLDNNKPRCSDWNGNVWDQQQDCYFGRGLVQLTWSCNYYKVQSIYTRMSKLFASTYTNDPILSSFINTMDPKNINTPQSGNVCANPDVLCGDYTLDGNTIIYSTDPIKQAIPWLSCISYWAFAVNPSWLTCYSFAASYAGIAPSGAGAYPDRLKAYQNLLTIMGVNPNYYVTTSSNTCLSPTINANCVDCSGGGGGGVGSKNYCSPAWGDTNTCSYPTCQTPDDCTAQGVTSLCYPPPAPCPT